MNKEFLSNMAMAELKALARNRGIEIKPRSPKYTIIQNILSYDKKNHYKKLGFESIDEWRKEELVIELKALGNKRGNFRTKKDIVHALQNKGQFPTKNTKNSSKSANKKNDENENKNKNQKAAKRKSILKRKEENFFKAFVGLENVMLNVFRDLQDGFKPVDEKRKLPHCYKDWQNKLVISEDLGELLDEFGDKILQLLPLILEIKSMANDFKKYKQKLIKYKAKKDQEKKTYYLGMKKYKKKKHYNNDEIGPICGVFDNIKKFKQWKNDKKVKNMYGKNIFRAKYVEMNKENDNNEKNKHNENESESEIEMESQQEEDESLSDEQDQDDMIPSDQDQDIGNNYKPNNNHNDDENDVAEIIITNDDNHNHNTNNNDDETTEDEDDNGGDNDVDMNKNKNKSRTITKKPAMTKTTRSRREAAKKKKKVSGRKRRRDNDQDTDNDNDGEPSRKRARLNKSTKK